MPVPAGGDTDLSIQLFELEDLENYLQQGPLNEASVLVARRVTSGWLRAATKLQTWPDPVPDDLYGWALELAGLVYNNPEGLITDTTGGVTATWERGRRDAILDLARSTYGDPDTGAAGGPLFSFPEPDWSWTAQSRPLC